MNEEKERLRDRDIHIRATEQEHAQIKRQMELAGYKTINNYLINMGMNGFVLNVDYSQLHELCYEIHKIGVNINQIAHKVNADDLVADVAIQEVNDKMDLLIQMVRKQFYKIP